MADKLTTVINDSLSKKFQGTRKSPEKTGLIRLSNVQIDPATKTLARAFQNDPLSIAFLPKPSERRVKLPYLMKFFLRYGLRYGEVHATSPQLEGVAVWIHPDNIKMTTWKMLRSGVLPAMFKMGWDNTKKQLNVNNFLTSTHQRFAPERHWYLQVIGVDPEFQGEGKASCLLRPMLERIDREQLPCYLETEKELNVPLFRHFGFEVLDESIIPETEVSNWAMLRINLT